MNVGAIVGISIAAVVLLVLIIFAASYVKAPPDTAVIITGPRKQKVLIGKAGIRVPFIQRIDKLPLNLIQVDIKTPDAVPTCEFINIYVDGVANIKIGNTPEDIALASQIFLQEKLGGIQAIAKEVLEGNMREIIGQMRLTELVHNRDLFAEKVKENAMQDMARMGLQIINLTIQNFSDKENVIQNLGVDNITQIQKDAQIARANSERDVKIAQAAAAEAANKANIDSQTKIIQQNTDYALKKAELKKQSDTAQANADAAYKLEEQKRLQEINIAQINADIAKRERQVELGEREVELQQKQLEAAVNKKADAEKYAVEQKAAGIEAVGQAEAQAIEQKAEAMKKMGEASVLQLILDSHVLPDIVKASSEPLAAAYSQIDNITMYGDGNTTKLASEITNNSSQIIQSVEKSLGIDLKSVLAGYLGGKLLSKSKESEDKSEETPKEEK